MESPGIGFWKGHGTENDFVLVPDRDGALGPLSADLVRRLCHRRSGLGADGVIRVVRTDATDDPAAVAARDRAVWFMDYLNADGSGSQMCGNGVRVLGRYLVSQAGEDADRPLPVATRAGLKELVFDGDLVTVDMGEPRVLGETVVAAAGRSWPAMHVDLGNPHAVALVGDLADVGSLAQAPSHDPQVYPDGVNVEFVVRRSAGRGAMRVHERGSGETRSCGTGACAAAVAMALTDGAGPGSAYDLDLLGGRLRVTWTESGRVLLTGPAVLVAEGNWVAGR